MTTDSTGTVVVLTALGAEYKAVRALLRDPTRHPHPAGTLFEVGGLDDQPGRIALAEIGAGNQSAAALTERAITEFRPRAVLFVGVAGALHPDLDLGTVVVATKIYGYHGGTDETSGFQARPQAWDTDHELDQLAREVDRNGSWQDLVHGAHERPNVVFRPIAAGEVVLNSQKTPLRKQLQTTYADAAAIELESAGTAKAAHLNRAPFLTIRGISDKSDGHKYSADNSGWQPIAAANAAAFAIAVARSALAAGARASTSPRTRSPKRTRLRILPATMIIISFLTGAIMKRGDINIPQWFRQTTEQRPVYATAAQLAPIAGEEPIIRLLPAGVSDTDRQLMSGPEWLNSPEKLGLPVGLDKVQIIIQAKETRLLLTGLRLVVDERQTPLTATLLAHGTQGGPGKPIQVRFDADAPEANTPRGTAARNLQGRDYFDSENYELDPGESAEFRATVSTRTCYCRWHLEVDVSLHGQIQPVQIRRSDGSLFEITAATPEVKQVYVLPHPTDPPRQRLTPSAAG